LSVANPVTYPLTGSAVNWWRSKRTLFDLVQKFPQVPRIPSSSSAHNLTNDSFAAIRALGSCVSPPQLTQYNQWGKYTVIKLYAIAYPREKVAASTTFKRRKGGEPSRQSANAKVFQVSFMNANMANIAVYMDLSRSCL